MTLVVLIYECGHWGRGAQGVVGQAAQCPRCPDRNRVRVIGEASPYQLLTPAPGRAS